MNCHDAHRRGAEIERLARAHDIIQRLAGLLDRRVVVEAMDDVEVDIVSAEPLQRGVDRLHDMFAREALLVGARTHCVKDLGGQHDFVTPAREFLDRLACHALGFAERIHVGRVPEGDPGLVGLAVERAATALPAVPIHAISDRHRSWCRNRAAKPSCRSCRSGRVSWGRSFARWPRCSRRWLRGFKRGIDREASNAPPEAREGAEARRRG